MSLIQWLRNLAETPKSRSKKTKSWRTVPLWRRARLGLERLEDRLAPATSAISLIDPSLYAQSGVLALQRRYII